MSPASIYVTSFRSAMLAGLAVGAFVGVLSASFLVYKAPEVPLYLVGAFGVLGFLLPVLVFTVRSFIMPHQVIVHDNAVLIHRRIGGVKTLTYEDITLAKRQFGAADAWIFLIPETGETTLTSVGFSKEDWQQLTADLTARLSAASIEVFRDTDHW